MESCNYLAFIAAGPGHLLSVVLQNEDGEHIRDGAVTAFFATVEAELEELLTEWARELRVERSAITVICLEPQDSPLGSLFDDPDPAA
jgi:hypothetical protein